MKVQYQNNSIDVKFLINIISLVSAAAYGWYQLESRISDLEHQMEVQDKIRQLQNEIQDIQTKKQLFELK